MADRIIPLSIGPEASLDLRFIIPILIHEIERLLIHQYYQKLRHEIISFLRRRKKKKKPVAPGRVTLPNINQ